MSLNVLKQHLRKQHHTTADTTAYTILFIISFTHLLNDMIQAVIPASYPLIKEKFGFSFAQIGLITLVFQLTSSLLQPFVGRYADRHPRPYSLATGMCLTLAGICLLATAGNFGFILLAVGIIGGGSSIFHPEASQVAQMAAGRRKGLAQSIFQVGGNGGNALGPLLAALIIIPYGQEAIGWFASFAILAAVILLWTGQWYSQRLLYLHRHPSAINSSATSLPARKVRSALLILVILMFSKHFYMYCMNDYFTFFLIQKFGLSIPTAQLCLFGFLAASVVGIIIGGALGDRFGRKYVIWGSILGAAPFTLLLPYSSFPLTIILSVIIGLVISSTFSAILVYATELMPGKVGMVAGIFFGLSFGLGGIGSAFFGWLADLTSVEYIFRISTLLPLLGIVAAFLPDIEHKKG